FGRDEVVAGSPSDVAGRELDGADAPAASASGRSRGVACRREALGREVRGVREAGRVAAHHAQSGAAVASGYELLDAPVLVARVRRTAVLDEHLGEVAAAAQRAFERCLEDVSIDQRITLGSRSWCRAAARLSIVSPCRSSPV